MPEKSHSDSQPAAKKVSLDMSHKEYHVGVLGATGIVGQKYIQLLESHPWFKVSHLAASPQSAGKHYPDAVKGRWHMPGEIPLRASCLVVHDASDIKSAKDNCDFVFSAVDMGKQDTQQLEWEYAKAGIPVFSNSSAHRWTEHIPMLIPEINMEHLKLVEFQKKINKSEGFIVVKPNCSIQSFMMPVYALMRAGYEVDRLIVTTMQALSGAGHPGVASLDIADNIIPYISGEEDKTRKEPLKIFGKVEGNSIIPYEGLKISATCTRVPVTDGHTAIVNLGFKGEMPTLDHILSIWSRFEPYLPVTSLPSSPDKWIIYKHEENRPQPRLDRDSANGMAITVGGLEECTVLDIKFKGLSHNTIRGAAGGGILNAELAAKLGYLD
jgi:aspartate-semialdehyde dehydrogenase